MTITQNKVMKAYLSAKALNSQKMADGRVAKKIFDLMKALQSSWDFQLQEEKKIFEAHPEYDVQNGTIVLPLNATAEEQNAATEAILKIQNELKALSNTEAEVDFDPFTIDLNRNPIEISGEDIGNLEAFITFE